MPKRIRTVRAFATAISAMVIMTCCCLGFAQTASVNVPAQINIVAGIGITNTSPLNFGSAIPYSGGVITLSPAGTASATGNIVLVGTASPATFYIVGLPLSSYQIILPSSVALLGPNNKSMNLSLGSQSISGGSTSRSLSSTGEDNFNLGGSLTVATAQQAGAYVGTIPVTVSY